MYKLAANLRNHLYNIPGKKVGGKIIVFESDDWGSLRMPSLKVFNKLPTQATGNNPFNRFDTLENTIDLEALFEVLNNFKDVNGSRPVFTTNFVVANPDFDKIRDTGFEKYYWESIEKTYKRYFSESNILDLIKEGTKKEIIKPQFHGREHLNSFRWMNMLNKGNKTLLNAFDKEVFCIDLEEEGLKRANLMASFDYDNNASKQFLREHLLEGTDEFNRIFGYYSESFIAPSNVWDSFAEEVLGVQGVKYIQSLRVQKIPQINSKKYLNHVNYIGEKNKFNQIYTSRNVYFEPATNLTYDWIGNALSKISTAFYWGKPAIISTHRINYVGGLNENNRKVSLNKLSILLKQIMKKWPDVRFLSSDRLGTEISYN